MSYVPASIAPAGMIEEVDRAIAQAERLLSEHVHSTIVSLRKGENATQAKGRLQEMRHAVEILYAQRRQILRAAEVRRSKY